MAGKTLQSTIEIAGSLSPSLQQAIKQAVDRLEEMSQETLESAGAAAKLAAEISENETILKNLQRGYEDYIVSGEESSDTAKKLADTIQNLSSELSENRGTLEAAYEAARKLTDGQEEAADAYSKLQRQIAGQESELDALRRSYANVVIEQGESSEEAGRLASRINQLSGDLNENRQRLNVAEQAAEQLGNSLEEAGQQAEDSSDGYTVLKNVLSNLVTEGIGKAVDAFKELATEGDSSLAMLEAKTGATSSEMEGFKDVMYEVYNSNYGDSLEDVSDKLAIVTQMTDDLDNASLAQITKNAIALEDVFGFDVTESMRSVNSLMDQFGISSEEAFNLIVQGAQQGLNQNDDLLDTINEYSVQFKNAGYSANDMLNMLANGAESGTWSIDKLGDAVKEYNIRWNDGTATEALKELGFNADEMSEKLGSGAESSGKAMQQVITALMDVEDEQQRYILGQTLMGTMWEDLGENTVAALMNTQGEIDSTINAMEQLDTAAYDTLESSFSQLGRTIKSEVVQPVAEELTPVLKNAVNYVNSNVAPAVEWITSHLPEVGFALGAVGTVITAMKWGSIVEQFAKMKGVISGLTSAFGGMSWPVMAVVAVIAILVAGFKHLWDTNEEFRENVMAIWSELQGSFSELGQGIMQMIEQLMPLIEQIASSVFSAFTQIAEAVLPVLVELIGDILPIIIELINQLIPVITQIAEAVLPVITKLINALLPVIMQIIEAVLPILVEVLNMLTPILDMIISLITPILNIIIALIPPILNLIMTAIQPLINIFSMLISSILQPLMPVLQAVASIFTTVLGAAIQTIQPIIQSLISIFQGLISFITGVFSGNWSQAWNGIVQVFGSLWDGLIAIVKAPINAVISLINGAINALNSISVTIPEWVPVVGGNTFGISLPNIPMLARGGFTDGISIAGEEGMEAVISFNPAYRDQNIAIWQKAGQLLGTIGSSSGDGVTGTAGQLLALEDFSLAELAQPVTTVIYDFSGFTWSPVIGNGKDNGSSDDLMRRLKAHEAEFFDWLERWLQAREVTAFA